MPGVSVHPAPTRVGTAAWSGSPLRNGARLDDVAAIFACEEKVRNGLPFPSSLSRKLPSTGIFRAPGDNPVVSFEADARNGLGFPLAVTVQCVFNDGRLVRLDVLAK
jgi:hypothetical protein